MEGMLMLLVMMFVTVVLAWVLDGKQRKQAVSLLLCAAMMSSNIPAITVARADSAAKPVLVNEQVLVNGTKTAQIGAVTYSASGSAYTLDTSSARVRVKNGDSISFDGAISAPEGEMISWVRVDVYDANTEEPYTVGAEYYRASGMKVQEFDLASIPALTIGEAFGSKDYTLVEGGKYIVMFCVGDSNGNTFADMDADIEDDQGPAILVDVKLSPSNCKHPHSDYKYVRHSSGEIRNANYGDALTHQVEPLYERYCGLCDSFLMNIWGQGTPEEHTFGSNGVCLACGYYAAPMMMSNGLQTAAIEGDITITEAKYIDEEGISVFWDCSNNACMYFRIEASIGGDIIFEETRKRNLTGSQNVLIPYDDLILGEECEIYIEGIAENSVSAEAITEGDTVYVDIPEGEFLNITDPSNLELEFGAEEESQMIYFEASGRWTAECDDNWVTLSKTSGGSDVVAIEVTVDANDGDVGVERETSIYIALSSGSLEEEIYIYQEGREMTEYEEFQAAIDDLEIDYASGDGEDAVTTDVGLPETGLYGVTISWESSNTSIVDDEGTVTRPSQDTEVELTATLSYYQYTEEKIFYLTVLADENAVETIELSADKTEINAGESVMFTAQSNADSVTLYIEAYNEVAGEWYVAVTEEMTKNGSEFTYTHEFANAGSKRVYAETTNGTTSEEIEITVNALKETLEAPVGGTMTAIVGEEVTISWGAVANATGYTAHLYEMVDGQLESIGDVTSLISGTSLKYTFTEAGEYHVGVIATAEGYNPSEQSAVIVTVEEATETITLSADETEINAGESVTFTAQSNEDSVTLYIEAYNEVAGEWYVAVTQEMTKNGSEFTYTHEFANAGSKRVYAKTTNGTTSEEIEITVNALKETLKAPVGGTMTATVGEEVTISWGEVANATGYTAHLYEMVDGQLESIGDVTDLVEGTSLKYTFTEAGEYHVGVTATAEGYNPSEQGAVTVTVEEAATEKTSPWFENPVLVNDTVSINGMIKLEGRALDDADLKGIYLYIDGINTEAYVHMYEPAEGKEYDLSDWNIYLSEDGWDEGYYSVKLDAEDSDGNFLEDGPVLLGYLTITGEESSPVIEPIVCTHESPITAGTEVTFSTTAADDVKLAKIELFIDGELKKTETVSDLSGTISYTTSALAIGEHTVKVVATDASGLTYDISLNVTVQKAESGDCAHKNTTIVRTEEYVSLGAEQHKLVYTDWTHCLDCDTGLSNVQDEDLPENHDWENGVCKDCKHACSHNFELVVNEKGENVAVVGSGKWQRQDDDYHVCTEVKYQTKCSICGLTGESDYKPAGWTEKHDYKWAAGGVDRNDAQHRFYEELICSLAACGDKKTVGEWENHQYVNGVCACGAKEENNSNGGSSSNNVTNGNYTGNNSVGNVDDEDDEFNGTSPEYLTNVERLPYHFGDYQLADQTQGNVNPTTAAVYAAIAGGVYDNIATIVMSNVAQNSFEKEMYKKALVRVMADVPSNELTEEQEAELKGLLGMSSFLNYQYKPVDIAQKIVDLSGNDDAKAAALLAKMISKAFDSFSKVSDAEREVLEAQFYGKILYFEALKANAGSVEPLLAAINELEQDYTDKFSAKVDDYAQAIVDGALDWGKEIGSDYVDLAIEAAGDEATANALKRLSGVLKGLEIADFALGIIDKVGGYGEYAEGYQELLVLDAIQGTIACSYLETVFDLQSKIEDGEQLTDEEYAYLVACYDLMRGCLISKNMSAKKILDRTENQVNRQEVLEQLSHEIDQLKEMSIDEWHLNEYYREDFFETPSATINQGYYFDAIIDGGEYSAKAENENEKIGIASRYDELSSVEKDVVNDTKDGLVRFANAFASSADNAAFKLTLVENKNGLSSGIIIEDGSGNAMILACESLYGNPWVKVVDADALNYQLSNNRLDVDCVMSNGYVKGIKTALSDNRTTWTINKAGVESILREYADNQQAQVNDDPKVSTSKNEEFTMDLLKSVLDYNLWDSFEGLSKQVVAEEYRP